MPRDGSGIYHRPVGTDAVTDTTIESTKYNVNVADVEQDLNQPRPIIAGGTGATSPDGVLDNISAEKFKQIVTNWDATVWRAGSFYAATTASGLAPVAGHAFAGITYYANATDFVCEATDLTEISDPTTTQQYIRIMTAGVWGPWTKKNAAVPIPGSLGEYTFDSGITFPPATGQVRFNNATQNSTTEVFLSHTTVTGIDNSGVIPFALKSGYDFYVQDKDEAAKWKMFTATADPVLSGGDYRVTATLKSNGTDIVSGQRVLFGANSGTSAATYAVRYDTTQTLTAPQKIQARQNIYASPFDAMAYSGMQVNGTMEVSQEFGTATTTVTAPAAKYIVDGFSLAMLGTAGASVTASQSQINSLSGFPYCLTMNCTSSPSLAGANDAAYIYQTIEGYRWLRLGFGTASAQPITIGFWVYPNVTGTMAVSVRNGATNRSYVVDVPLTSALTWQYKTVTIPGDSSGSWPLTNVLGGYISFCFGAGSGFKTAANTWTAGNFIATPATTNLFTPIGASYITGVTFIPGSEGLVAARSPFIMRPYDQELALCRRYLWKRTFAGGVQNLGTLQAYSATLASGTVFSLVPAMRSAPTVTFSSNGHFAANTPVGGAASVTSLVFGSDIDQIWLSTSTFGGGLVAGNAAVFYVNFAGAWIMMDARL